MLQPQLSCSELIHLAKMLRESTDKPLREALRFTLLAAGYHEDAVRLLMCGKVESGILVEGDCNEKS